MNIPALVRGASKRAARSPRVRNPARYAGPQLPKALAAIDWPLIAFEDAYNTGLVPLSGSRCVAFLTEFFGEEGGSVTTSSATRLLKGKGGAARSSILVLTGMQNMGSSPGHCSGWDG